MGKQSFSNPKKNKGVACQLLQQVSHKPRRTYSWVTGLTNETLILASIISDMRYENSAGVSTRLMVPSSSTSLAGDGKDLEGQTVMVVMLDETQPITQRAEKALEQLKARGAEIDKVYVYPKQSKKEAA